MKRLLAFLIAALLSFTAVAYASEGFDLSTFTYDQLIELSHAVINELVTRPEWNNQVGTQQTPASENNNSVVDDGLDRVEVTVNDYVGLNLESCGYTSMGGDRRDYCADTNLLLVLVSTDGSYVNPNDKQQLREYRVVAQTPAAGTPFSIVTYGEEKNKGYEEIILFVTKDAAGEDSIPTVESVNASPNRETHYLRDYTGRTLENVGYVAMNGNRYDTYGPDGLIQIVVLDANGQVAEIDDEHYEYYIVTDQNVAPNTELSFTYATDDDGDDEAIDQSLKVLEITVEMSDIGAATLAEMEAREAELRASGTLVDMYQGTYEVGVDIKAGYYTISELNGSSNVYTYTDEAALESEEGEWYYLSGSEDAEYIVLRDGMILEVRSGAIKALWSEIITSGAEFSLYSGVYYVGTDIEPGNYEMTQLSDTCNVYIYKDDAEFAAEDGNWSYLSGEGDVEYFNLKNGMIVEIKGGAVIVTQK